MRDAGQAVAVRQHRVKNEDARRHGQQKLVQLGQRPGGEYGFVQAEIMDVFGDGVAPVPVVIDDDDRHGAARSGAPWEYMRSALVMLRVLVGETSSARALGRPCSIRWVSWAPAQNIIIAYAAAPHWPGMPSG
ncbi:hypothetical protein D3C72_1713060 [compost metagenome]